MLNTMLLETSDLSEKWYLLFVKKTVILQRKIITVMYFFLNKSLAIASNIVGFHSQSSNYKKSEREIRCG